MISKTTEYIVYESPDGGETVYQRAPGQTIRELHSSSDKYKEKIQDLRESQLWYEIRMAARNNPALQEAMDQCIMIYKLSKEYQSNV